MLLDQRIVAGLGNIYVCEALFRARIDPRKAAGRVGRAKLDALAEAIPAVLEEAIAAGGSTLRDFAQPDGELGYFSKQFDVYGREGEPCRGCAGKVKRIVQGGGRPFTAPPHTSPRLRVPPVERAKVTRRPAHSRALTRIACAGRGTPRRCKPMGFAPLFHFDT